MSATPTSFISATDSEDFFDASDDFYFHNSHTDASSFTSSVSSNRAVRHGGGGVRRHDHDHLVRGDGGHYHRSGSPAVASNVATISSASSLGRSEGESNVTSGGNSGGNSNDGREKSKAGGFDDDESDIPSYGAQNGDFTPSYCTSRCSTIGSSRTGVHQEDQDRVDRRGVSREIVEDIEEDDDEMQTDRFQAYRTTPAAVAPTRRASSVDVGYSGGKAQLWCASRIRLPIQRVVGWKSEVAVDGEGSVASAADDGRGMDNEKVERMRSVSGSSSSSGKSSESSRVARGRRGVYIPSEFRTFGRGPKPTTQQHQLQHLDRIATIDDGDDGDNTGELDSVVPDMHHPTPNNDHLHRIDLDEDTEDWKDVVDRTETNNLPLLATYDRDSDNENESDTHNAHQRHPTPPPTSTRNLHHNPIEKQRSTNRLARWKPTTLNVMTEDSVAEQRAENEEEEEQIQPEPTQTNKQKDTTAPTPQAWRSADTLPAIPVPAAHPTALGKTRAAGWFSKMNLLSKLNSSTSTHVGGSSSASLGAEHDSARDDAVKKNKIGAQVGSQTTLGGSSTSLTGSQTNMALPKPAEGDQAPTATGTTSATPTVKHKWFRPLFPKLHREDKKQQLPQQHLSNVAQQSTTTVNLLTHIPTPPISQLMNNNNNNSINPMPTSKHQQQKQTRKPASRSRKEIPLFKRLMMRRERQPMTGNNNYPVATTSDPNQRRGRLDKDKDRVGTLGSVIGERGTGHLPGLTRREQQLHQQGMRPPLTKPLVLRESSEDLLPEDSERVKAQFDAEYRLIRRLGAGGHSTVKLASRVSDSSLVVCKFIQKSSVWHWVTDPHTRRRIPLEVHVMQQLTKSQQQYGAEGVHAGIIRYIDFYNMDPQFVIVMEYLGEDWVDLYDYVEEFGPVELDKCRHIFGQVVETVEYLHWTGFVHNDIKDENIMINKHTRQIKLIDFGSTTQLIPGGQTDVFYGTRKFASPEAVQGQLYHPESQEVWALGTLLFVLLFKVDPFKNDHEILDLDIQERMALMVAKSRGDDECEGVQITPEAAELVTAMMEKDWGARLRVGEILGMPFFEKPVRRREW
ncbi:hypothetical protein PhCBS80983_g02100 [Powellomyces hirtus]|uniref:Protein kinase domain-containing protein n=1 Tax=Powellomyces hirtus TaxID=109895 RepID=A0A507E899_9FUNG|nr:hypothetical protein PhCBS80983_g02100 [Powellomyces hirtus]